MGDKEKLRTDLENLISQRLRSQGGTIIHITKDTGDYKAAPPQVQEAIDLFNNLELMGYINETLGSVKHTIGLATAEDETALQNGIVVNGVRRRFGEKLYLNQTKYIHMYCFSLRSWFGGAVKTVLKASVVVTSAAKSTLSAAEKAAAPIAAESHRLFDRYPTSNSKR